MSCSAKPFWSAAAGWRRKRPRTRLRAVANRKAFGDSIVVVSRAASTRAYASCTTSSISVSLGKRLRSHARSTPSCGCTCSANQREEMGSFVGKKDQRAAGLVRHGVGVAPGVRDSSGNSGSDEIQCQRGVERFIAAKKTSLMHVSPVPCALHRKLGQHRMSKPVALTHVRRAQSTCP